MDIISGRSADEAVRGQDSHRTKVMGVMTRSRAAAGQQILTRQTDGQRRQGNMITWQGVSYGSLSAG